MTQFTESKQVLLLSDNEVVAKLINHIGNGDLSIARFLLTPRQSPKNFAMTDRFDLIILALSRYENEPIVVLAQAALSGLVGHIPILIISDKPFRSDPATQIVHMGLPFSLDHLNAQVRDILHLPQLFPRHKRVKRDE